MKKKRFSGEKTVGILREWERDGQKVEEVSRKYGICEQTLYRWRRKYGGMGTGEVKRLRQLEDENGRLKKLVAERDLEIDGMKEILKKNW